MNTMIIWFVILRFLDVVSTLLSVNTYGIEVEANPIVRYVMGYGLFIPYQIILTVVASIFFYKTKSLSVQTGLVVLNVLTIVIVFSNFVSYFIAQGWI